MQEPGIKVHSPFSSWCSQFLPHSIPLLTLNKCLGLYGLCFLICKMNGGGLEAARVPLALMNSVVEPSLNETDRLGLTGGMEGGSQIAEKRASRSEGL